MAMKLNLAKQNEWEEMIHQGIADEVFPGAVLLIGDHQQILYHQAFGSAQIVPETNTRPATPETIYDLASLTKVVCTTTLVMQLLERGQIRLDDPVDRFFPGFAVNGKEMIRLRHLLTHSSGLPAWAPLYLRGKNNQERFEFIKNIQLENPIGTKVLYSDLGFILLGEMVAKLYDRPLADVAKEQIFDVLEMSDTCYNPPEEWKKRIAATEVNNDYETNMSNDTEGINRREGVICGTVHDGNCYAMGGVTGHAGLFSTAKDLYQFVQMLLNQGQFQGRQFLSPVMVEKMTQNYTGSLPGGNRALGWDKADEYASGGDLLSPLAFGHTGFTGTSIWIDPAYDIAIILLTNRVHPTCSMKHIRFRPLLHNRIFSTLEVVK